MAEIKKIYSPPKAPKIKKVAAYVRVSSSKDAAQKSALTQSSKLTEYILSQPGWSFAGLYADIGVSGTKETRDNFQKLIANCHEGKIDLIVTKSISRFARNMPLLIEVIRKLKAINVGVYFDEQGINTLTAESELIISLIASYCESISRISSENALWRIKRNFEEGKPWSAILLGYKYSDGKFIIDEKEAEIVRRIYREYLSGSGYYLIAKGLNADGVPTRNGPPWKGTTVAKILKNYNYTGNLLLQKTFRTDYKTKSNRINHGEKPKYLAKGTHEAIIDSDTFDAVQMEMLNRALKYTHEEKTGVTYPLTGKIRCGHCGKNFNRKTVRGKKIWICSTYNKRGKQFCNMKQIHEDILLCEISKYTDDISEVEYIEAQDNNTLIIHLSDETITTVWKNPSRADSWTEEMKETARNKTLERRNRYA